MAKYPATAEQMNPDPNASLSGDNSMALNFRRPAPAMIGTESRKEKRAASRRSNPNAKAVVIVMPDRETPGMSAKPWLRPIAKAVCQERSGIFLSPLQSLSAKARTTPRRIKAHAINRGDRKTVSTLCSNRSPARAPGIVATIRNPRVLL